MARLKIKWNSERLLSLTAMLLSFTTLLIFIYQTNLMRKQNYLSILPYLQLSTSDDPPVHSFQLNLKNHGVGPAILESVMMEFQGARYDLADYNNELVRFMATLDPVLDSLQHYTFSTLDPGIAIPAGTSYSIVATENAPEDYRLLQNSFNRLMMQGLRYEIVYRSIQDERWIIYNGSEGPQQLD